MANTFELHWQKVQSTKSTEHPAGGGREEADGWERTGNRMRLEPK